jgi:hypothetical protein
MKRKTMRIVIQIKALVSWRTWRIHRVACFFLFPLETIEILRKHLSLEAEAIWGTHLTEIL